MLQTVLSSCMEEIYRMGMETSRSGFQILPFQNWQQLPRSPGVYIIVDTKNQLVAYVGMSYKGRGGIRIRNKMHHDKFNSPETAICPNGWRWYMQNYTVDVEQLQLLFIVIPDNVYDVCALEMNLIRKFQPMANEESFTQHKRTLT